MPGIHWLVGYGPESDYSFHPAKNNPYLADILRFRDRAPGSVLAGAKIIALTGVRSRRSCWSSHAPFAPDCAFFD
jgi:hypothetical protein